MRLFATLTFLAMLLGCSAEPSSNALQMLQGGWKSDKDGTIAELKKNDWWTDERLAMISNVLGKLAVRYEGDRCVAEIDGSKTEYKIRVIQEQSNTATLEWDDPALGTQRSKVEIFDDHLWVTPNDSTVFRERFSRQ